MPLHSLEAFEGSLQPSMANTTHRDVGSACWRLERKQAFFADQALGIAHHQHVAKHRFHVLAQGRHEVRQRREMRLLIARQRNEHHVLHTRPRHRARRGDAARVGEQHYLEQYRRIVGRRASAVVLEACSKTIEVNLVVDQVAQRVLEGARQQLPAIRHRDHLGLLGVVVPVSRHRCLASFAALLRA